jgi:hypothetical protein
MYRIRFSSGDESSGINFTDACQQIQNMPSVSWRADIERVSDGWTVRLDGRLIAVITPTNQ